jgi:divalent metal cation (Fe/Co/Zn/Cd) transporter
MDKNYYNKVVWLAVFTIVYNIIEGLVSLYFGIADETIALAGFGADSFIEVMSGIGILIMVLRLKKNPESSKYPFEITALKTTGWGFYILAVSLVLGAIINIIVGHKPDTTFWGVCIAVISIVVMFWLYKAKMIYGLKLNSDPVISDAKCTLVCIYMSIILLASSVIFELTGIAWIDSLGAIGLAWFSYKEGKEAFEKAKGKACSCCNC